jgi:hypothetical protein
MPLVKNAAQFSPQVYKAVPVRKGACQEQEATWACTCPITGCHYGVQLDDLQVALDAVSGHLRRVHDYDAYLEDGAPMPPVGLLTMALEEFAEGRPGEALGMIRDARDRLLAWVVE